MVTEPFLLYPQSHTPISVFLRSDLNHPLLILARGNQLPPERLTRVILADVYLPAVDLADCKLFCSGGIAVELNAGVGLRNLRPTFLVDLAKHQNISEILFWPWVTLLSSAVARVV